MVWSIKSSCVSLLNVVVFCIDLCIDGVDLKMEWLVIVVTGKGNFVKSKLCWQIHFSSCYKSCSNWQQSHFLPW